MRKVIITGFTIATAPNIAGVQRVCRELLLHFDKLLEGESLEVEYLYPEGAKNVVVVPEEFRNIKATAVRKPFWARNFLFRAWLSVIAKRRAKGGIVGCCLSHEWPFGERNVSFLYDMRPVTLKCDRVSFRRRFKRYIKKCRRGATLILTDSDFQSNLIREYFGWGAERVQTIYPGWEHMKDIVSDGGIFERYPVIREGEYFYTLGSLAPHKNFGWMMEVAKRNPEKQFVIAGGKELETWKDNIEDNSLSNVLFVGRVTDGENKALMEHCRAFLFPSKFEGFGIPPLEALHCGAPVACSNATCLPEVYEDCVRYFDPDDYGVDLDELMARPVASPEKLFEKCSWNRAAKQLLEALKAEAEK